MISHLFVTSTLVLVLLHTVVVHAPPPSNTVCSNATAVDLGVAIVGNFTFTSFDIQNNELECSSYTIVDNPALWYKVTNTLPTHVAMLSSTCTTINTVMTVFEGNYTCTARNSTCLGWYGYGSRPEFCSPTTFLFLAKPFTTYYIVVQPLVVLIPGYFSMTIDTNQNYLLLINSTSDQIIDLIRSIGEYNFDYSKMTSLSLNIEAVFDDSANTQSVMIYYDDDPTYTHCELRPPFSVFMDIDGDFFDGTIPPGRHTVAANSYSQPDCTGIIGSSLYQEFYIEPCPMEVLFYQVSQGAVIYTASDDLSVDSLPCNDVNIQVVPTCGFVIEEVQFTLRRYLYTTRDIVYWIRRLISGKTEFTTLIRTQTERAAPYYLFGNTENAVNGGTIDKGKYYLEVSVNGVPMGGLFLYVLRDCD